MAKLIQQEKVTEINPTNGKHFQLEELQGYVSGLIVRNGEIFVINEKVQ